jgi:hypothetical protein
LFWLKSGYFAPNAELKPLLMTWSLGVEEQFYLFFPILMLLLNRFAKQKREVAIASLLIASLALSVWGMRNYPTATFYLLPTRAWELAAGALIAIREARKTKWNGFSSSLANALSFLALGFLVISIFFYSRQTIFPGLSALLPVAGAALLIMTPSSWLNRIVLSSKPMVFVGLVSYSWYLLHWPLLSFARILADRMNLRVAVTIAFISFLLAVASHRLIEQPFRRSPSDNKIILQRYLVVALGMMALLCVLKFSDGWPARFPGLSEVEASGQELKTDPCLAGYGESAPNLSTECVPVSPTNLPGVALLGDSHAAALAGALRRSGRTEEFTVFEFTKSSCPALAGVTRLMPSHPRHDRECAAFNARVMEQIQRTKSIQVVILAGFWSAPFVHETEGERFVLTDRVAQSASPAESRDNFARGLDAMARTLRALGKRVIVLKDNPMFDFDPVYRVRERYIKPRMFLARLLEPAASLSDNCEAKTHEEHRYDDQVSAVIDDVAAASRVTTFDLKKPLCDGKGCYFFDGTSLLYEDSQHLSLAGAERGLTGLNPTKPISP